MGGDRSIIFKRPQGHRRIEIARARRRIGSAIPDKRSVAIEVAAVVDVVERQPRVLRQRHIPAERSSVKAADTVDVVQPRSTQKPTDYCRTVVLNRPARIGPQRAKAKIPKLEADGPAIVA